MKNNIITSLLTTAFLLSFSACEADNKTVKTSDGNIEATENTNSDMQTEITIAETEAEPTSAEENETDTDAQSITGWWKRPDRENNMELATIYHLNCKECTVTTYDVDGKQYNEYEFSYENGEYIIYSGDEFDDDVHMIYDGTNLLRRYELDDVLWLEPTDENPVRTSKYSFLCGDWHLKGEPDGDYIIIDTQGFYEARYADGTLKSEGSIETVEETEGEYRYDFIDPSGNVFIGVYMDSETQFHIGNADDGIYVLAECSCETGE